MANKWPRCRAVSLPLYPSFSLSQLKCENADNERMEMRWKEAAMPSWWHGNRKRALSTESQQEGGSCRQSQSQSQRLRLRQWGVCYLLLGQG